MAYFMSTNNIGPYKGDSEGACIHLEHSFALMSPVVRAVTEESCRTGETFKALARLHQNTQSLEFPKELLQAEYARITDFTPPQNASYALKTHKLKEILSGTLQLYEEVGAVAWQNDPLAMYGYQPGMRANFTVNHITSNSTALFLTAGYYAKMYAYNAVEMIDPLTSPLFQGVTLPNGTVLESMFLHGDKLVVPNKGYFFGGSREEPAYQHKLLRAEDCSSAVAKWIESKVPFSTLDMLNYYQNPSEGLPELQRTLLPKGQTEVICDNLQVGDVYMFRTTKGGGHTGMVTGDICVDGNPCFAGLSYSRNMPTIDGLAYSQECPETMAGDRTYYFFSVQEQPVLGVPLEDSVLDSIF